MASATRDPARDHGYLLFGVPTVDLRMHLSEQVSLLVQVGRLQVSPLVPVGRQESVDIIGSCHRHMWSSFEQKTWLSRIEMIG